MMPAPTTGQCPLPMISYAHNREDVVLNRVFGGQPAGFYIDIGASHPDINSVTKHFSLRGWRGVNVEPHLGMYQELCKARLRDINLNAAVSDRAGSLTYFEVLDCSAESTLSDEQARRLREQGRPVREHRVEVFTLADLCERHAVGRDIDFLSIDVEGHEKAVLLGADFRRWRPRVLIVEATEPCTSIPSHHKWEDIVLGAGYLFTLFDGINRFYVRDEDQGWLPRLGYPANPLDGAITAREAELAARDRQFGRAARLAAGATQWVVNRIRRVIG